MLRYAIIGAGKGGHAAAGHIKLVGHPVNLWNRPGEKIDQLKQNPKISLEGKLNGAVLLDKVTDSLPEALEDADIISLMVTSNVYAELGSKMAPYLKDGQKIILNCGGIGGTLLFLKAVKDAGFNPKITVGETDTCVYGCKTIELGKSLIKSIKNKMTFTALPIDNTEDFLDSIKDVYPQFVHVKDPLAPGIWDATCLHTAGVILNEPRIRAKEKFLFYVDGISPEIADYMEHMDQERVAVARAMGLPTESVTQWYNSAYGVPLSDLHSMLQKVESYQYNAFAPTTFNHRYLTEEVPTKLIPQLEMAAILGISQSLTREIVERSCELLNKDFFSEGRTLSKLGLSHRDIKDYYKNGIHPYLERNGLI